MSSEIAAIGVHCESLNDIRESLIELCEVEMNSHTMRSIIEPLTEYMRNDINAIYKATYELDSSIKKP